PRWQRRTVVSDLMVNDGINPVAWHILRDRWSTLLIGAVASGTGRFNNLKEALHVTTHELAQRLSDLTSIGILQMSAYSEWPLRNEYRLTPKVWPLHQTRLLASGGGDRWLADPAGVPLVLEHTACGHEASPKLRCSECGEALRKEEITFRPPTE